MLKQHVKCMKKNIRQFVMAEWDRLVELCSYDLPVFVLEKQVMALMDYASVAQTYLLWKSFFFHAARPGYTDTVFLNPLKQIINVFTAGKFRILKILLIVLQLELHFLETQVTLLVHK